MTGVITPPCRLIIFRQEHDTGVVIVLFLTIYKSVAFLWTLMDVMMKRIYNKKRDFFFFFTHKGVSSACQSISQQQLIYELTQSTPKASFKIFQSRNKLLELWFGFDPQLCHLLSEVQSRQGWNWIRFNWTQRTAHARVPSAAGPKLQSAVYRLEPDKLCV